jgi:hypothetical protein
MSMSICLAKVSPVLAQRIETDPELLNQVWLEADDDEPPVAADSDIAAIDRDRDLLFEDYLGLGSEINDDPARYPWMQRAVHGTGREIDFDFGYGNGFLVAAREAAEIAAGLAHEGWWRPGQDVTLIPHAVAAFYQSAADEGLTVIGGVS